MAESRFFCKQDGIRVRVVPPSNIVIGKKVELPEQWVHISTRSDSGAQSCGRRILTADDVEPLIEVTEA